MTMEPDATAPQSDSSDAHEAKAQSETTELAEKVRYWQEQDRINRALIPRVLALHEELVRLGRLVEGVSERLAAAEERATQTERTVEQTLGGPVARLQTAHLEALERRRETEADLRAELDHLRRRLRYALWTGAALLAAVGALVAAFLL